MIIRKTPAKPGNNLIHVEIGIYKAIPRVFKFSYNYGR